MTFRRPDQLQENPLNLTLISVHAIIKELAPLGQRPVMASIPRPSWSESAESADSVNIWLSIPSRTIARFSDACCPGLRGLALGWYAFPALKAYWAYTAIVAGIYLTCIAGMFSRGLENLTKPTFIRVFSAFLIRFFRSVH